VHVSDNELDGGRPVADTRDHSEHHRLVSSAVRDLSVGSGQTLADRGEHDLKGVPGPWRIYAVET
jgi:class 3 adenylate cyclase